VPSDERTGSPPAFLKQIIGNPRRIAVPFAALGFVIGLRWDIVAAVVVGPVVGGTYWYLWRPGGPNRRKVLRRYGPAAFGLDSERD
jgi:hypothetical protein